VALTPGTRLGSYEISALIGAGGMGEVYRAADTNLKRQVAVKILPQDVAQAADRLARFQREAELLAALNHPNIAAIYGLERADGQSALVMELVEGPTLANRIAEGAMALDDAVPVAKQIAAALEAAHEQGIVHRDLKPANIKVRPDGTVKVLDFGLAKAIEPERASSPAVSMSPTITTPAMTQVGLILGTAAYMSPEQARGRSVDKRTDIWAFGCVLFEMLTGRRVFEGDDVTDVFVAVLSKAPDWAALPASTPTAIQRLLRRSLERDPRRRLADISDARLELEDAAAEQPIRADKATTPSATPLWRRLIVPGGIAIVAAGVATAVTWMSRPTVERPIARYVIALAPDDEFTTVAATRQVVAISPDGASIAYMVNARLYIRARDRLASAPITTGPSAIPFFSPDGQSLGFWQDGQLKTVSVNGGAPFVVCNTPVLWGATWTADGTILYGQGAGGIWRVSANGGKPEQLIKVDAGQRAYGPQLLPSGRDVLFTLSQGRQGEQSWDDAQIVVHSLDTGTRRVIVQGGTDGRYLPTGHLAYVRQGTLLARPFDVTSLEAKGAAVPLVDDVAQSIAGLTGAAHFSVSGDGTLVYVPSSILNLNAASFVWVDAKGQETPVPGVQGIHVAPSLSPDGTRVAFNRNADNTDVWTFSFKRGILEPLASEPGRDSDPIWSPDGQRIAYYSTSRDGGPGIFVRAADGTGDVERLTTGTQVPSSWYGTQIVYSDFGDGVIAAATPADLGVVSLTERRGEKLLVTPFRENNAVISPDGRWLAYESSETNEKEIVVRPFPDVRKGRARISTAGGTGPVWARDGRSLFYQSRQAMMAVAVRGASPDEWGAPEKLFEGSYFSVDGPSMYDVARDGRFLMLKPIGDNLQSRTPKNLIVVENWAEELKQRVPVN
jgi:serine/threonine-protein kinase